MRISTLVPIGGILMAGFCLSAGPEVSRRPGSTVLPGHRGRAAISAPAAVSAPVFDADGGLIVATLGNGGRPALRRIGRVPSPGEDAPALQVPLAEMSGPLRPVLRQTANGRLRTAWIEEMPGGGARVLVGHVDGGPTSLPVAGRIAPNGITAMDYAVDPAGRDWAAWAEYDAPRAEVRIRNFGLGLEWAMPSPAGRSVIQISLDAGPDGRLWLLWSAAGPGPDRLFAAGCDGDAWSSPAEIGGGGPPAPRLCPKVRADAFGLPWAAWAAHDGGDYEIFASRRAGGTWTAPVRVTDNDRNDVSPAIAFAPSGRPLVVFARAGASYASVMAACLDGPGAGGEISLVERTPPGPLRPEAAWSREGFALAWEEDGRIRTKRWPAGEFPGPRLRLPADDPVGAPPLAPLASLDDDVFIGFGDSITYGTINDAFVPERGYLPRLQELLEPFFGSIRMVNEGWPGEITVNGMGRLDDVLAARRGRTLLLMEGTNDVIFLEISMEATAFHLEQMVLKCRRAGVFPVLATIIPRSDWRWDRKIYRDRIEALNAHIRRIAVNFNIPLVDMFEVFYNNAAGGSDWTALISDGVHPTDKGYEVMTQAWFTEVRIAPFPALYVALRPALERALLSNRRLNVLSWQHNPKLADPAHFARYRVYRRDLERTGAGYELIAALPLSPFNRPQSYNDLEASPSRHYGYAITLVRLDGVEGAPSDPVND